MKFHSARGRADRVTDYFMQTRRNDNEPYAKPRWTHEINRIEKLPVQLNYQE
jgi:hypothetical protein